MELYDCYIDIAQSYYDRKKIMFKALSWLSGKAVEPMMPKQQPQQTKEDEVLVEVDASLIFLF